MNTNDSQKRLLCIVGGMNTGGAETFLMKVYRELDKTKYQFDFYVSVKEESFYDKEIISMGGKIYHSIPKSQSFFKSLLAIKETVKSGNYKYVIRISQHSISSLDLLAARHGGAKTLIYRSSNSSTGGGKINRILHGLFKWLTMKIPTIKIAPSTEAAGFMFGKNSVEKGEVILLKNAIPVENFMFDQEKRDKIRKEFKIEEKFVVGHVGRFNFQKNHSFLIDVFKEIVKVKNDCVLLLVGKGELENDMEKKIERLNLKNKVIFAGVRSDVSDIMMAMDIFIFPSYFEGMPNTVIEAQATGLKCIISDSITKEAQITDLVSYQSINSRPIEWAKTAIDNSLVTNRYNIVDCFKNNGYDIKEVVKEFEDIIFA